MRMKRWITGVVCVFLALTAAQSRTCEKAETMQVLRRVNNYFMGTLCRPDVAYYGETQPHEQSMDPCRIL